MIAESTAVLIRLLCGAQTRWVGAEPLFRRRVYFCNHTSNLDTVVLWAALPPALRRLTRPVAAADYWKRNAFRRYLADKVFHALLIERHKVTTQNNPVNAMLAALDEGASLILFPEGTRHPGPEPRPFKSGLFHLARKRPDTEFFPVYLDNLNRVLPKGELLPVPLLANVAIGAPLRLEPDEDKAAFLERARLAVWALHQP